MHFRIVCSVAAVAVVSISNVLQSQSPRDVLPMSVVDSTIAVALKLDELAQAIRTGTEPRRSTEREVAVAASALRNVAVRRARKPPDARVGVLWDFVIDSLEFKPQGRDRIQVEGAVRFTTETTSDLRITLEFERRGNHWEVQSLRPVIAQLNAMTSRLAARQSK